MDSTDLGKRISTLRQNKGLTQEELASRLGVTPQALSKWERNQSLPDVLLLTNLCQLLECSADSLLGISGMKITENDDEQSQAEIRKNLRDCLEPLELTIGLDLVFAFVDNLFVEQVVQVRKNLSKEGILMPLVRIRDDSALAPGAFTISAYHKILYRETFESISDLTCKYIIDCLEQQVREQYAEILNRDLTKGMVENLREKYPVLIAETIPSRISYGFLTDILKHFIREHDRKGGGCLYLARIIDLVDQTLRERGTSSAKELASVLLDELG